MLIAIEGPGGAGKSTLAKKIQTALGSAYVINIDDFLRTGEKSDAEKSNFDRERLEKQVLYPAKQGSMISYQRRDADTNTLGETICVPTVDYLIIEGVSTFHPSVADYFDFKIWVEVPTEVAAFRGSKRDKDLGNNNDRWWGMWTSTYVQYKEKYHPERHADFVYDNSATVNLEK